MLHERSAPGRCPSIHSPRLLTTGRAKAHGLELDRTGEPEALATHRQQQHASTVPSSIAFVIKDDQVSKIIECIIGRRHSTSGQWFPAPTHHQPCGRRMRTGMHAAQWPVPDVKSSPFHRKYERVCGAPGMHGVYGSDGGAWPPGTQGLGAKKNPIASSGSRYGLARGPGIAKDRLDY